MRDTFWLRLHKELLPILKMPKSKKKVSDFGDTLVNTLLGKEAPKKENKPLIKLTPRHDYLRDLLYEISEVQDAVDSVFTVSKLLKAKPAKATKLTRIKYLKFIYGAYLNELYIYEMRLVRLLTLLERRCKRAGFIAEAKTIKDWIDKIEKAFDTTDTIRGHHVHLRRYKNKKVEQIELLDTFKDKNFNYLQELSALECDALAKQWSKEALDNADGLDKIFNEKIFRDLEEIVFTKLLKNYRNK